MRIKIDITVNLSTAQVEAFESIMGSREEQTIKAFILAHGITALEDMAKVHEASKSKQGGYQSGSHCNGLKTGGVYG